ncbi:MAG: sugar phosphate isomerase/epimerase [Roseovarius sp.]|nr:sugar phosphate isomerase/epimerase [Roseovarius sp.]
MIAPSAFLEPDRDTWRAGIAQMPAQRARTLAARAAAAPLFAHAYSFHLNFRFGGMMPVDLLDFAASHGLKGVKIHVEDGEENSLLARPELRHAFGERAAQLGLEVHIEISETRPEALARLIEIAGATGATSVRCYPRYEARVSRIIATTIADLRQLQTLDAGRALRVTLEQHEDLTSCELVDIVRQVGDPNLSLLFDFGNMINAHERPLEALRRQAAHITEVHIKDCFVVPDRGGWAQMGCVSGTGHIPFADLLVGLLLLGEERAQVTAFALEEEVDYFAPAMRFPDEESDPLIGFRTASLTDVAEADIAARLIREKAEATAQVATVRALLAQIETAARDRALAS